MEARKVTVYVRLYGENENARLLSFERPSDIPQIDLLHAGLAIDGNAAVGVVVWNREAAQFRHPSFERVDADGGVTAVTCGSHEALVDALACAENQLVRWFAEHGYEAQFE